ncbi:tetratricopeptide repeat protein [Ekhidna sp.]|uniref:tetratricopeptide repeat-containing sensor histidine kinase n=1 Tax=Ekhidna sp. TaxID=2608089 RepID=UPI0032EBCB12
MRKATYILSILFSLCLSGQSDSLIEIVESSEGNEKVDALHNVILDTWLNYPEKAMQYGEDAFTLAQEIGDSILISKSLRLIAGVYYYKGDYDQSLEYNQKALALATLLKDSSLMNNGYNNIGLLYYNLGSYQIALEYLLRAKAMKEKIGEEYGMATTLNNIGLIFDRLGEYDEARIYFNQAFGAATGINKKDDQVYALNNVGLTYLKQNKLDGALSHFRRGRKLAEEIENINWGAVSLRGIGGVLLERGDYDSAYYYFQRSLENSKIIDDKKGIAEANYFLAQHAMKSGNYSQALDFLDSGDEKAKQMQLRQQQLENLKLYASIYENTGNTKLENEYLKKYINLRDSLFLDVVSRNLNLIPLKLKEEEDRFKLSEQQVQIRNQVITNQLFTLIIIITVPLLIVMIILLRKNDKKNKELQQNNEELKRTQKLLITSEKMASLGVLAAGVGHEINNPLNFIKNGIEALSKKLEDNRDEELRSYFKIVNEGVDRATNIVKSLSHFSRKGPDIDERCNIHEIIENCLLILHSKIRNRIRIITNFTSQGSVLKGNEGRLHQAMMNIIANAEQAIKTEGTIEITTRKKGDMMEIWIEDDGEGIPEENLMKISDPFFTTKAPGEGTGLGLFITFSIIEEHNGHIDVKSSPQGGTKFIIQLPL